MKLTIFLTLFSTLLTSNLLYAQSCPISQNSCEFYDCAEKIYKCGAEGYLLKFGKRNCDPKNFEESKEAISLRLETFIKNMRACVQREFLEFPTSWSCDSLKDAALDSHTSCLIESGYCDLSLHDVSRLSSGMGNSFNMTSPLHVFSMGLHLEAICVNQSRQIRDQGSYYGHMTSEETRTSEEIIRELRTDQAYALPLKKTHSGHQPMKVIPYFFESISLFGSQEIQSAREKRNLRRRNLWLQKYL